MLVEVKGLTELERNKSDPRLGKNFLAHPVYPFKHEILYDGIVNWDDVLGFYA